MKDKERQPFVQLGRSGALFTLVAALLLSGQSSKGEPAPAFIPSQTATDQTQIFNYTNLDQTPLLRGHVAHDGYSARPPKPISGASSFAGRFNQSEIEKLALKGLILGSHSGGNQLELLMGNVFLRPNSDIVVKGLEGEVSIGANASVFVMENGRDFCVYDLYQSGADQVAISCANKTINLSPGSIAVITTQEQSNFNLLPDSSRRIPYRDVHRVNVTERTETFIGSFDIASALLTMAPLKQMLPSQNPEEKKTINQIIKASVLLTDLLPNRGPFQNGVPNR
ncbi:unnamed protein product [Sphagnum balticum]